MANNTHYRLRSRAWHEIKKLWPIVALIGLATVAFGDISQIMIQLYTLSMTLFVLLAIYIVRRWMMPSTSLTELAETAKQSPIGAAVVYAAIVFFMMMILLVSVAKAYTTEQVLEKARVHMPMVIETIDEQWPAMPLKQYEPAKVEQETCASLSKCWNPSTEFRTSREYGFGFGMITVTQRFNNFEEAKKYAALKDWEWSDRFNPKYQMIYSILQDRKHFNKYSQAMNADVDRWACALVSYNAGSGTVNQRLALCKITEGCDATRWFGGLDGIHRPYEDRILYGRPLWKLRNDYPENIIKVRAPKYEQFFVEEPSIENNITLWQRLVAYLRSVIYS